MNKEKLKEVNKKLIEWEGAKASFSTFTDSHFNVLTIKLTRPDKEKSLGIGLFTCSYISGSMNWESSNIGISYDEDNSNCIVRDKNNNFLVKCMKVSAYEDLTNNFEFGICIKTAESDASSYNKSEITRREKKLKKHIELFKKWRGANATFRIFTHVDNNILLVKLSGLVKGKRLSVGFRKCKNFSGPVEFEKINFIIHDHDTFLTISDEISGFFVTCEDIYVGDDVDMMVTAP